MTEQEPSNIHSSSSLSMIAEIASTSTDFEKYAQNTDPKETHVDDQREKSVSGTRHPNSNRRISIGFSAMPVPEQITRPDFNPQISLAQSSNSEDRRDLPFCRPDYRSVVSVVSNENVSDLNNFPNLFKKGKFKCVKKQSNVIKRTYSQVKRATDEDGDGKNIALCAIRGNVSGFKKLLIPDWENWEYMVEVKLPLKKVFADNIGTSKTFSVTLSLHHIVALVRQDEILQFMLKHELSIDKWQESVIVSGEELNVLEDDSWIFNATCLHLTTKFNTTGLHMILDHFDMKKKEELINRTHCDAMISPLHVAAGKGKSLATSILIHHGAPPNCIDYRGFTPLFWAVRSSSMKNIIELIDHGADVNHVAVDDFSPVDGHVFEKTPLFRARTYDIIRLLLLLGADPGQKAKMHIRKKIHPPMIKGSFIKYICEPHEVGEPLINYETDNHNISAIEHLMQFHPECPKAILDNCLAKQKDKIVMDFNIFEDDDNEMSVFVAAEKNRRKELFLHPLLQIFLSLKWHSIKPIFWIKIFFQVFLVIILTLVGIKYVEVTHCSKMVEESKHCFRSTYKTDMIICHLKGNSNSSALFHLTTCPVKEYSVLQNCYNDYIMNYSTGGNCCILNGTKVKPKGEVKIRCMKNKLTAMINDDDNTTQLKLIYTSLDLSIHDWKNIAACILIFLVFIKEMLEMHHCIKTNGIKGIKIYIENLQNLIQCFLIGSSLLFLINGENEVDLATHTVAWMVFLAWIDLTLYVGKIDFIGEYIYMSVIVSKTIFTCLLIYIPTLLAFTFGFYILLKSNPAFESASSTFVKILAMKAGELEYKDDFDYYSVMEKGGQNYSVQVMFVFFLVCISLIVMNLLLTVTLNKTENLVTQSKTMRAGKRIKDVIETDSNNLFCFKWLDQLILPKCKKTKDKNHFVSIKNLEGYTDSIMNKIRKFFKMDQLKELYMYEEGKQNLSTTGMDITELLFKEAKKFVTNKNLSDIEFKREISHLREKSKWELQNVLHINIGKVGKADQMVRRMSSTDIPKNEAMEYQNLVSSLENSVFKIGSEQSKTTEKLNKTLHYYDEAVSDIREQLQEVLKNQKLILEARQTTE